MAHGFSDVVLRAWAYRNSVAGLKEMPNSIILNMLLTRHYRFSPSISSTPLLPPRQRSTNSRYATIFNTDLHFTIITSIEFTIGFDIVDDWVWCYVSSATSANLKSRRCSCPHLDLSSWTSSALVASPSPPSSHTLKPSSSAPAARRSFASPLVVRPD